MAEKFDLVASTLLLSQLGRPLQTYFHQLIPKPKMDHLLSGPDSRNREWLSIVDREYQRFLQNCQSQHFGLLAESVRPGGEVFVSMTPRMEVSHDGNLITTEELIDEDKVQDSIRSRFEIVDHSANLSWESIVEYQGEKINRTFQVETMQLRRISGF